MMSRTMTVMTIVVLLVWPAVCIGALAEGDKSPEFKIETLDGKVMEVNSHNKNPLLIIFWATWCPHCIKDVANIKAIHEKYGPKGLEVVGINAGHLDTLPKVQVAVQKYGMSYPVAFDEGSKITRRYQVTGLPTFVLVDRDGTIRLNAPGGPATKVINRLEQYIK
jgi:peroxiredoxin